MSQILKYGSSGGGGGVVDTLSSNTGGAVSPNGAGNINVVGDGTTITGVGNPGTNTITFSLISGSGIETITGDTGGPLSPTAGNFNIITDVSAINSGSSFAFTGSGSTLILNVTDSNNNTLIGLGTGNATTTGAQNTGLGKNVLGALTDGFYNNGVGFSCLASVTSGSQNCGIGVECFTLLTQGNYNIGIGAHAGYSCTEGSANYAIGQFALDELLTGNFNTAIGYAAGSNYGSSESFNIILGSSKAEVSESQVMRLGNDGSVSGVSPTTSTFIQGISGVSVTGSAVLCSTAGQLGTISSSRSLKEDIEDMNDFSSKIYNLKPKTFKFIGKEDMGQSWGLIAEEVHEDFEELCLYDKDNQPASVKYHDLPALLLNEIQKMRKEIDELKVRIPCQ